MKLTLWVNCCKVKSLWLTDIQKLKNFWNSDDILEFYQEDLSLLNQIKYHNKTDSFKQEDKLKNLIIRTFFLDKHEQIKKFFILF